MQSIARRGRSDQADVDRRQRQGGAMTNAPGKSPTRGVKRAGAKKKLPKRNTSKKKRASGARKSRIGKKPPTAMLSLSAKLDMLAEQVAQIRALVELVLAPARKGGFANGAASRLADRAVADEATFDEDLAAVVAELDRSARHSGMVPIPEVLNVFMERGWSRRAFDERLLRAERDFVVDLKVANDPSRLDDPGLAIQQPGRGYLQYVVAR
jgi:hypothetical protein